ncbi:MAG: Mpo1-like protein [Woeseiaceae bacterium]|nr:Mpo1-like protein [Woeseiaceae bacterium]
MAGDGKLMEMLTGYAAAHQHPVNVFVHMIGIPTIMLGVLIPLTWPHVTIGGVTLSLAHVVVAGFFLFYLTLDRLFAIVFLVLALALAVLAAHLGALPLPVSGTIAALAFFGGYTAQFIGHAVEKSMPVLVRHPVQANLAAPFFTVVELFKLLGLRDELFRAIEHRVAERRQREAG